MWNIAVCNGNAAEWDMELYAQGAADWPELFHKGERYFEQGDGFVKDTELMEMDLERLLSE